MTTRCQTARSVSNKKNKEKLVWTDEQIANATPPWPEWNDAELSTSNWEIFDDFRFREYPSLGKNAYDSKKIVWRRVDMIFPEEDYQVVEGDQLPFIQQDSVFGSNRHLMTTEIFRMIMFSLKNVSFLSCFKRPDLPHWEPWQHVYKKEYNPDGKYFVKLFFLGKWRRLIIDDYLPCDADTDNVLIPFISPRQLWLPLLCKAILIVASFNDFDWRLFSIGNLLTGCFSTCVQQKDASEADLWEQIRANVPDMKNDENKEAGDDGIVSQSSDIDLTRPERYVLATVSSRAVPYLNTTVPVLIQLVINQCYLRKYAKSWKDIRYNQWAYDKGILKQSLPCSNSIGHIQIFCPVRIMHPHPTAEEHHVSEEENLSVDKSLPTSDDICLWIDFPGVYPHLIALETMYIPSSFEHQYCFTSEEQLAAASASVDDASVVFRELIPQSCFYLFLDNLQPLNLMFVIDVCSNFKLGSSSLLLQKSNIPELILEPYCWKDLSLDCSDKRTCRYDRTANHMIPRGMNIYKLWHITGEKFFLGIFSVNEFKIISRSEVNHLTNKESLHVSRLVSEIISKFNTLLHTPFMTFRHGVAYNDFIEAFCPGKYFETDTHVSERTQIKAIVVKKLENLMMEKILDYKFDHQISNKSMTNQALSSTSICPPIENAILQVVFQCRDIFQNPGFGKEFLRQNAPHFDELIVSSTRHNSQSSEIIVKKDKKTMSSKALLQRKAAKERKMKTKEAAATASRIAMMNSVLETIFENNASEFYTAATATPAIKHTQIIESDLQHKINLIEFWGTPEEELLPSSCSLIARLILNVHSETDCLVGIYFTLANAEHLMLQLLVIRNTYPIGEPLTPVKASNYTFKLRREELGYTVMVYGCPDPRKVGEMKNGDDAMMSIKWKLQLVSDTKPDCIPHICQKYPSLFDSFIEETEMPHPPCNFDATQTCPTIIIAQWTDHIEARTHYELFKFQLTTWAGNILTLRFHVASPFFKTKITIIKYGRSQGSISEEEKISVAKIGGDSAEEERSEAEIGGDSVEKKEGEAKIGADSTYNDLQFEMGSCPSFVHEEEEAEEEEEEEQEQEENVEEEIDYSIILTEESTTSEVIIPVIITTPDICSHDEAGNLVLEGTVEIFETMSKMKPNKEIMKAKKCLLLNYLTQKEYNGEQCKTTTESDDNPNNCDLATTIDYYLTATYSVEEKEPLEEVVIHVDQDLQIDGDPETIKAAIKEGREERLRILDEVYREAPCLGQIKHKVPKLKKILRELYGQEMENDRQVTEHLDMRDDSFENNRKLYKYLRKSSSDDLNEEFEDSKEREIRLQSYFVNKLKEITEKIRSGTKCHEEKKIQTRKNVDDYLKFRHYEKRKYAPNKYEPNNYSNIMSDTSFQ